MNAAQNEWSYDRSLDNNLCILNGQFSLITGIMRFAQSEMKVQRMKKRKKMQYEKILAGTNILRIFVPYII